MNAYFNDATLKPSSKENMGYLPFLLPIWEEFVKGTNGCVKKLIFPPYFDNDKKLTPSGELAYEVSQSGERDLQVFFSRIIKPEFMQEIEQAKDSDVGNKYDNSEYKVIISSGEKEEERPCPMLGWTILNQGIAFGLASSPFWNRPSPFVDLEVEEIDPETCDFVSKPRERVCCITRKDHLQLREIKNLLYQISCQESGDEDETDEVCDPPDIVQRRLKGEIWVLGISRDTDLLNEARERKFNTKRFHFVPYDELTNFDCRKLKNDKRIAAIMIGQLPHSGAGMGEANNLKNAIRKEGYPPSVELKKSTGKLMVTTTSFREGLDALVEIKAIATNFDR